MKISRVIEVIKTERECVNRNEETDCGRKCSECDLALETEEVLSAYDSALAILEDINRQINGSS